MKLKNGDPLTSPLLAIDSQINWCACSQVVACRLFSLLK